MPDEIEDDVSLCNGALIRFGAGVIADFEEESELALICNEIYFSVVDAILEDYDWQLLRQTKALEKLADPPINGWKYAYSFPNGAIGGVITLFPKTGRPERPLRRFAVEGRTIYADVDGLRGVFKFRLSSDQWTATMRNAVKTAVAAALCIPVSHHIELADKLEVEAFGPKQENRRGGLIGRAIAADHAQAAAYAGLTESIGGGEQSLDDTLGF